MVEVVSLILNPENYFHLVEVLQLQGRVHDCYTYSMQTKIQ